MKIQTKISYTLLLLIFLTVSQLSFGQKEGDIITNNGQKFLLYQVKNGETISDLKMKFDIEQGLIIKYNPQLVFGINEGDVVKILLNEEDLAKYEENTSKNTEEKQTNSATQKPQSQVFINENLIFHLVKKKETIYAISKLYNIPIDAIYTYNPEAKAGVLENEILRIPKHANQSIADGFIREDETNFYHQIQPGETLYGIAKRYNASVASIVETNSGIDKSFNIGRELTIPKTSNQPTTSVPINNENYFIHRVELGDTFYSYKRRFGVNQETLIELNPVLNEGLKAGIEIKIPTNNIPKIETIIETPNQFQEYLVQKGETLYRISTTKNVKIREIKDANPELYSRGLIAGETIFLPIAQPELNDSISVSENEAIVEYNETSELPEVKFEVTNLVPSFQLSDTTEFQPIDTFRVTMFLPLFYDRNMEYNLEETPEEEFLKQDSIRLANKNTVPPSFKVEFDSLTMKSDTIFIDTLRVKDNRSLIAATRGMLAFYEGFALAVDSLEKAGQHVELRIVNSEYSKAKIDSLINNDFLLNSDLIVGPVAPVLQGKVSAISAKNQIPLVSPLSNDNKFLSTNPYYFQVSPSKDYILRKTAEFIAEEYYDKNFVVLTLGNDKQLEETRLVDRVREKFFTTGYYNNQNEILFTEVDFTDGESLGYWHLKKVLKKNEENIVFIPTTDDRDIREAMLSRAINSLYVLSEEFEITLVGMNDYPRFKSINTEYFHRLNLHYLTSTYVDYSNKNVNTFIRKYRNDFKTEPNEYAFRGYDIAWYFGNAVKNFGKNYVDYVSGFYVEQLQDDLNFQRIDELQGYMNYSLNLMNYTPNWEVIQLSKITEGRTVLPVAEHIVE